MRTETRERLLTDRQERLAYGADLPAFFCFWKLAAGIWNVTVAVTLLPGVYGFAVTSYNLMLSSCGSSSMPILYEENVSGNFVTQPICRVYIE